MTVTITALSTSLSPSTDGHRTYKSKYRVVTDDRNKGPLELWTNASVPQYGDFYTWNSVVDYDATCQSVPAFQLANENATLKSWIATVTHTTKGHQRDSQSQFGSPLDEPWKIEGDADEWTEEAKEDKDGNPLQNSVLEPLRGFEITKSHDNLVLSKNFATLNRGRITATRNRCNSQSVMLLGETYGPRQVLCRRIRYQRLFYGRGVPYFPHTFHLAIDEDGWNLRALDWGTREKTGNDANDPKSYTDIADDQSGSVGGQWALDGNGNVATNGKAAKLPDRKVIEEYDFNVWGFPAT